MDYSFEIDGRRIQVDAPGDDYRVFIDGHYSGIINPVFTDNGEFKWVSADLISQDWADKIGDAIERADM